MINSFLRGKLSKTVTNIPLHIGENPGLEGNESDECNWPGLSQPLTSPPTMYDNVFCLIPPCSHVCQVSLATKLLKAFGTLLMQWARHTCAAELTIRESLMTYVNFLFVIICTIILIHLIYKHICSV